MTESEWIENRLGNGYARFVYFVMIPTGVTVIPAGLIAIISISRRFYIDMLLAIPILILIAVIATVAGIFGMRSRAKHHFPLRIGFGKNGLAVENHDGTRTEVTWDDIFRIFRWHVSKDGEFLIRYRKDSRMQPFKVLSEELGNRVIKELDYAGYEIKEYGRVKPKPGML